MHHRSIARIGAALAAESWSTGDRPIAISGRQYSTLDPGLFPGIFTSANIALAGPRQERVKNPLKHIDYCCTNLMNLFAF